MFMLGNGCGCFIARSLHRRPSSSPSNHENLFFTLCFLLCASPNDMAMKSLFFPPPIRSPHPPYLYACLILSSRSHSHETPKRRICGTHKKYIISVLISICLSLRSLLRAPNVIPCHGEVPKFFFASLFENCFLCLSVVSDLSFAFLSCA